MFLTASSAVRWAPQPMVPHSRVGDQKVSPCVAQPQFIHFQWKWSCVILGILATYPETLIKKYWLLTEIWPPMMMMTTTTTTTTMMTTVTTIIISVLGNYLIHRPELQSTISPNVWRMIIGPETVGKLSPLSPDTGLWVWTDKSDFWKGQMGFMRCCSPFVIKPKIWYGLLDT